jgi:hypothetical protein
MSSNLWAPYYVQRAHSRLCANGQQSLSSILCPASSFSALCQWPVISELLTTSSELIFGSVPMGSNLWAPYYVQRAHSRICANDQQSLSSLLRPVSALCQWPAISELFTTSSELILDSVPMASNLWAPFYVQRAHSRLCANGQQSLSSFLRPASSFSALCQ